MLGPGLCFQKGPFKTKKNEGRYKGQTLSGNANRDQWMHPQMFPFHPVQPPLPTPTRMSSIVEPFNPEQMKQKMTPNRPIAYTGGAPAPIQSVGDYSGNSYNTSPDTEPEQEIKQEKKEIKQEPAREGMKDSVVHTASSNIASTQSAEGNQTYQGTGQQIDPSNAASHTAQQTRNTLDMLDALRSASTDSLEQSIIKQAVEDFTEIQYQLTSSPSVARGRKNIKKYKVKKEKNLLAMAEKQDELTVALTERSLYGAHIENQQAELNFYYGAMESGLSILEDTEQKLAEAAGNRDAAYAERGELAHQMEKFKLYMSNFTFLPKQPDETWSGISKKRKTLFEQNVHTSMIEHKDRMIEGPSSSSSSSVVVTRSKGGIVKGGITGRI